MLKKIDKLVSPALRNVLCACMFFSWIINAEGISLLFFGEYPYPER